MQHSTQGIVLGVTRYKDNAYIATIFTKDFGKISYTVYNPQSKRATVRMQHLGAMTLLDMEVTHRENKDLQKINEVRLHPLSYALYEDPAKISLAVFMADVVQKSLESKQADAHLFDFLVHSLETLINGKYVGLFALSFLLDYAKMMGIYPYDEQENEWICYLNTADKRIFMQLLQAPAPLTQAEKRQAMQLLLAYFQHYLPGMEHLKSVDVLTEVFSA